MSHALASYVPRLLLDRLASDKPLAGPEAKAVSAAVLLSDIQGFTSLVDVFTRSGRAGLEELTRVLNAYFADLVAIVDGHGGDVLYVAGDAFYCYWPAASSAALPDAVHRATQAGLAIQSKLDRRPAGHDQHFATRLGIGAGRLAVAFAGGVAGRWELIATGEALRDCVRAQNHSTTGQVVLSPHAWSLVASRCGARSAVDGHVAVGAVRDSLAPVSTPPRSPLPDEERALRPYLPPAVLDRMVAPQPEWLAELRTVTVLMADLPAVDEADTSSVAQTHTSIRAFQDVVQRFEGTIKVDVDDKGILLLAVFGLPPRAHENDAERAVVAAWALRESLQAQGLVCGIGIATGRCFCGPVGSDVRREYMLRGDVINLAARLMKTTASQVACDDATTHAVRGRIRFDALPPVSLKGRAQPVPVFLPLGRAERVQRHDSPPIGRAAEQAFLHERLDALASTHRSGVVVVQAEAGLGKSRLVESLIRPAAAVGVHSFTAAADAIERSTAFYAWRPVFASLFGVAGDVDSATAGQRVAAHLARLPGLERLMPLLGSVLPIQVADNELTAEMNGEVRADNTMRLLTQLLQDASAKAPTLLVVEDAHWLDSSSWSLLLAVVQSVNPLLTVVTTRPFSGPANDDFLRLLQLAGAGLLRLQSLSHEDTVALIRRQLGVLEVPPALAEFAQQRVCGHPFFCEELIRSMADSGVITVDQGVCTVGDLTSLELPTTVEGVILSRLDRLAPDQQLCLKVASVIGQVFLSRAVKETFPVPSQRERTSARLDALTQLDLTERDPQEAGAIDPLDPWYRFKHAITRDVTYELMPLEQRRPLHRAVAEWHERNPVGQRTRYFALLAHHWERASDPIRSVEFLEQAGQQALRDGAFREALVFFTKVSDLHRRGAVVVDDTRRAMWEKGVGTAHYFLGDLQQSRQRLESAVALLDQRVPAGGGLARALLGAIATQVAHRILASRYVGRRKHEKAARDEAVHCYTMLGQIYFLDGEPAPRLAYLTLRGLNVGEEAGPSPNLARVLINMAVIAGLLGTKGWADWYANRAIEMVESRGQYASAAYVWSIHALIEAQRGKWAEAKASNERAMALIQELGDHNLEGEAWAVRARVTLCEGDYAAATQAWARERELADRHGNEQLRCWSLLDEVDTLLGCGDAETAATVLDAALAVPTAPTDGGSIAYKNRALAMTRLRQGRIDDAVQAADVVIDLVSRQPPTSYYAADNCAAAVEVYLSALRAEGAHSRSDRSVLERSARKGCRLVKRLARIFENLRPRSSLLDGHYLMHLGQPNKALASWAKAAEVAVVMEMPFEQARALLEIGRVDSTRNGDAALAKAAEIFERLGAGHCLGQLAAARVPPGRGGKTGPAP